jgi:hypothetical protein
MLHQIDTEDSRAVAAGDPRACVMEERLAGVWDGSFHLAYGRWLAEAGRRVGGMHGASDTAAASVRPSDGRSNHRRLE